MSENRWKARIPSRLGLVLVIAGAALGIWVAFRFVVTDAQLTLQYLEVLAWPSVALAALVWLREPIRERFASLLRLHAFGTELQFASETRQLESDLAGPVSDLAGTGDEVDEAPETVPVLNEGPTQPVEEAPAEPDGPFWWAPVRGIGQRVGMEESVLDELDVIATADPEEAVERIADAVDRLNKLYRRERNANAHRTATARENIERVIRSSAEWGYQLGRSGSAPLVPDIQWAEDGTWSITTQVPSRSTSVVRLRNTAEAARAPAADERAIRALEEEIKKIERANASPMALSSTVAGLGDKAWLRKLKDKLRAIDPTNPWAD